MKADDWTNPGQFLPRHAGEFKKEARVTTTAQVAVAAKKYSVPAPNAYSSDAWRKRSSVERTLGTYKSNNVHLRITPFQEAANTYGASPLLKYNLPALDKIKEKPRYFTKQDAPRFPWSKKPEAKK